MKEPTHDHLGGPGMGAAVRRYLLATRPKFLTASVLPVVLGSVYGAHLSGSWNVPAFVLAVLGMVLAHAGINVLNDVYDEKSGNDRVNEARIFPYSGGSRVIQNGVLSLAAMTTFGWALLGASAVVGLALAGLVGWGVIWFGVAGVALGVFYSAPPLWLSGRGLGEMAVAVGFGLLPVMGAAWVQVGAIPGGAVILSVPVSLWIANVLLINEVPDAPADASVGRRTLVVALGRNGAALLYGLASIGALIAVAGAAALAIVPVWVVIGPALLLMMARSGVRGILSDDRAALKSGIERTLAVHALGTIWLTGVVTFAG